MKTFYKILTLVAVSSLALVSCAKKELPYEAGAPELDSSYGVYFPVQEASGSHTYDPEMDRSITITVARPADKSNGAITVPYTLKATEEGIFKGGEIVFADGQTETEFEITFDNAEVGVQYTVEALVDDPAYTFVYGTNPRSLKFSILIVTWEDFLNPKTGEPAIFTINSRWDELLGPCHATLKYYDVAGLKTGVFTSVDKDEQGNPEGMWHSVPSVTLNIRWYSDKNNNGYDFVELPKQYFGYDYNDGDWLRVPFEQAATPIFAYDYAWYWVERGYAFGSDGMGANWLEEAKATGQMNGSYPVGYYDGNGGFYFNIYFYMPGLGGWSPDNYGTVAIAEGFTRVDYSLSVESDYTSGGSTPVLFTVGADVAKVDYAIYEGTLTAAELKTLTANISSGKEENVETVSEFTYDEASETYYASLGVSPEATGEYTLVAVAFNKTTEEITKSEAQASASVSFFHVTADDEADYDVQVSAFTEDTPSRYKELHAYDSFAYGVSGKDLTEVHIAFYTSDIVSNYGLDAVIADAKADEDGEYAVSEDILKEINADGGYYTVATGLKAKTTYVVVVWATNGSKENVATASYTTDQLPYVWNSLGKGTITDGFFVHMFGNRPDYTVACDVYEEATTPGLYMISGFQCALTANFFSTSEEEMAQYENGNWRNSEVVVDATNPDAVVIPEQDYGVLVNSNYGWIKIQTEATGKLENGAITFPVEEMYVYLGAWYYANGNGTFKITLPSAATPASVTTASKQGNGYVENITVSSSAKIYDKPVIKYEREAKAISVETKTLTLGPREGKQPVTVSTIANQTESVKSLK